jgi:hypothetical protein
MKKVIIDCATGITLEEDMTAEEIAQLEADGEKHLVYREAQEAEAQAKAEAKASALAKLEALGLTEEEAAALIS